MPNSLFTFDQNNPALFAPRPTDNTDINWNGQAGNPGLAQLFDEQRNINVRLFNEMDATQVGKGIQSENLANGAVKAENQREIINSVVENKCTCVQGAPASTSMFSQVDGQPLNKKELHKWQGVSNFRNFQAGVDNITSEMDCVIRPLIWHNVSNIQSGSGSWGNQPWYNMDVIPNSNDYGNVKIVLEVAPDSSFLTGVQTCAKRGFFWAESSLNCKLIDKTPKLYQNPWYRVVLYLEKNPDQAVGIQMQLLACFSISITQKIKNKHI